MKTESQTIKINTPVNETCPYCGHLVMKGDPDTQYTVSGHGRFRKKQYFHYSCYMEQTYGRGD